MSTYNHKQIEEKWSKEWDKNKIYKVDLEKAKNPFYNLAMFPYPSGEGLHIGHIIPYSGVDTYGRYLRMNGYDVFEPMGFDAFGIHSENYAIKKGIHPQKLIAETTTYFREKQMKRLGALFDWDREVNTTDPNYYKWTQWLFIQMYKHGLAEKRKAPVTYCPSCKTVLSDEQTVIKNAVTVCERCSTPIVRKELEQWFFKITNYADRLLSNLTHIDWSTKTKNAQREWIGKKTGINITYQVDGTDQTITCFTTRPDTNFGATFIVLAPEHSFVKSVIASLSLSKAKQSKEDRHAKSDLARDDIELYVQKSLSKSEQERIAEGRKKTGVPTGFYAINQLNNYKMPIYVSDFVLGGFGTGAVVGVPGHDLRDFQFAKEFNIPIIRVVVGPDGDSSPIEEEKQVNEEAGTMINSEFLNGVEIHAAIEKMMDYLEEKGWGRRVTSFKLRDWCISRQRYWGPPIPMIYCEKCKWQPVPEDQLPVTLPFVEDYKPVEGQSPLARDEEWVKTKCPNCGGSARRETDVSDTFLDSSWYFLRYPSVGVKTQDLASLPWDKTITKKWLPVDIYIGGHEHAVLHLMYARFVTMALKDFGFIDFEEPFKRFFAHGLMTSEGAKMSKSKGNVVNPNEYMDKYGSDTLRMYILFMGPYDAGSDFRMTGIAGMYRFINRIWKLINVETQDFASLQKNDIASLQSIMHKTIKKVGDDISILHFNTAIAGLMEYYNYLNDIKNKNVETQNLASIQWQQAIKTFLILLAPFAPFITEELWFQTGHEDSIHNQPWPKYDEKYLITETVTFVVQVNGKVREKLQVSVADAKNKEEMEKIVLENPRIQSYLKNLYPAKPEGRSGAKKLIFVPGKLMNVVV